jgi:hypothetical protein
MECTTVTEISVEESSDDCKSKMCTIGLYGSIFIIGF